MMGLKKDYKTTHLYFISFDSPNLLGGRGGCVCVWGGGGGGGGGGGKGWNGTNLDKIHVAMPRSEGWNDACAMLLTPGCYTSSV